jgi:excinuclease UvrABC ATPase subunit
MHEVSEIRIRGARQHNLKVHDLSFPKNRLVVFTGVSGSGKSSLAFDTIYAEGQRRYIETLSSYARQFLGQWEKPLFDRIEGLTPTVAIEQKKTAANPRSTVGTMTEIWDHMKYFSEAGCSECGGARLRPEAVSVFVGGKSIVEVAALSVAEALAFFAGLKLPGSRGVVAAEVLKEIGARLQFLESVGLSYLSLDRQGPSLSGGEAQRIRLASQLGGELSGILYVLDEPSVGLHGRDHARLIETLRKLRDRGNSVLVVEHDAGTIRAADWVVDLGPGAGEYGFGPGRFSFNVAGGRCEACGGDGVKRVPMHFLPDVWLPCEVCGGKRYNAATLRVRYRQLNIADVLDLTVAQALEVFRAHPELKRLFETLRDVGMDYVKLGQPASTLSGGEAQRIKLSRELGRTDTGRTLYILDEPTTGLHFDDLRKLLSVLDRLVDAGNTVLVIEHNLDVILHADHVIDLGPEGGADGGRIVAVGPPEEIARCAASHTGKLISCALAEDSKRPD